MRGVMGLELTMYGPIARAAQRSLRQLGAQSARRAWRICIASMRDADGRILIDRFYDDVQPPTRAERDAIAAAPAADSALRAELQLARTEANNAAVMRADHAAGAERARHQRWWCRRSSRRTPSPPRRDASIDFRLVPRQRPWRVRALVEAHARKQGFFVVHRDPTAEERAEHARILKLEWEDGYPASRSDMSSPAARAVIRAVEMGTGDRVIVVPTSGGSLPLYHFVEVLGAQLITVPIVNHDNSQHAANENLRLQNLFDGIQVYAGIVAHLGRLWTPTP